LNKFTMRYVDAMSLLAQLSGRARGVTARSILSLPRPVIRRLAGAPVVIGGRTLDPEMQLLLRLQRLEGPPTETLPISRGRRQVLSQSRVAGGEQPIGAVTDRTIDGPGGPLTLRFYTPRGLTGAAPALVYFHGGAWIYGDLDSHDATCRFLAEEAQVRVVAVDYRLAPEAPFPAAFDDAWAAWTWIAEHAKGIAIGLYSSIQFLGTFVGAATGGFLYGRWGASGIVIANAVLLVMWIVAALGMRPPERRSAGGQPPV